MRFDVESGSSNNEIKTMGSSEAVGGTLLGSFEMTLMAGVLKFWEHFQTPSIAESEMRFREQKRAFMEIPPLLLEQYRGQFVASLNGKIVDHDSDYVTLVHRFFRTFGDVPAFITKIGERRVAVIDTPFID